MDEEAAPKLLPDPRCLSQESEMKAKIWMQGRATSRDTVKRKDLLQLIFDLCSTEVDAAGLPPAGITQT